MTLPDSVLVATLLNKTSGSLQQHLRLNARTLDTYENVKSVILAYYQSRHVTGLGTNNGPAPMDVGALTKGKGRVGQYHLGHWKGKDKGKGRVGMYPLGLKGKGKGKLDKGKGKGKLFTKGKMTGGNG